MLRLSLIRGRKKRKVFLEDPYFSHDSRHRILRWKSGIYRLSGNKWTQFAEKGFKNSSGDWRRKVCSFYYSGPGTTLHFPEFDHRRRRPKQKGFFSALLRQPPQILLPTSVTGSWRGGAVFIGGEISHGVPDTSLPRWRRRFSHLPLISISSYYTASASGDGQEKIKSGRPLVWEMLLW